MRLNSFVQVYTFIFLVKITNVEALRRRVEVQMSGPQIDGVGQQYVMNPTLSALVVGSLLSEHPALAAGLMGMYQNPSVRLQANVQSPVLAGRSNAPAYNFNAAPQATLVATPKYISPNSKPPYAGSIMTMFDVEERPRR